MPLLYITELIHDNGSYIWDTILACKAIINVNRWGLNAEKAIVFIGQLNGFQVFSYETLCSSSSPVSRTP
jgi:hypothetical protein